MNYKDPYLVVGTGRCGTSTIARILHKKLDICMGHSFIPSDRNSQGGYYEDAEFVSIDHQLCQHGLDIRDWAKEVLRLISIRESLQRPWGMKNIRMITLLGLYLGLFDSPRLIWCKRKREDVVASIVRCYSPSVQVADEIYFVRMSTITRLLQGRDYLVLDFTEQRDEKEIEQIIREKWNL